MPDVIARASDIEVNTVPDGYIVYQGTRDRVHYLNNTAAIILELCDGTQTSPEIVTRVAAAFELDASAHTELKSCIDSLIKEGLVQLQPK